MGKHGFDYDLIVIGSGAAGSTAATIAATEGASVAIIESDIFGGDSPNFSDVPMKALLHAANLYDEAKNGSKFGLRTSAMGYNYPALRAWKDMATKRTGASDNRKYYENKNIDTYIGLAHFLSPNEISVDRRHLSGRNFLIATGSSWTKPSIIGLDNIPYFTPKTIIETLKPPKSLLIIGGDTVGVEIAQLMSIFGTKVTIAEIAERLLPRFDGEVGEMTEKILASEKGISILTHCRVLAVERDGLSKKILVSRAGTEKSFRVDEIVVTSDRSPNVDMGLENAGVKFTPSGIKVNEFLQTNVKHIYAAGDVIGRYKNTHVNLMEGQFAANNILSKNKVAVNYTASPQVVYINPNIATVGLSEDDCMKRDLSINKSIVPLSMIARSNTADFSSGFVKIVTDKKGMVLGGSLVAPHGAEMIHELTLAVKYGLSAADIASTPHAFLSWNEAIRLAASKLL